MKGVNRRGNEPRETRDRLVMGIKEGTYCMENWVLYTNNESWNTTSKTKDVMYGD